MLQVASMHAKLARKRYYVTCVGRKGKNKKKVITHGKNNSGIIKVK